jgi:hypothetical protein
MQGVQVWELAHFLNPQVLVTHWQPIYGSKASSECGAVLFYTVVCYGLVFVEVKCLLL